MAKVAPDLSVDVAFVHLDDLIAEEGLDFSGGLEAVKRLAAHGLGGGGGGGSAARGIIGTHLRWTAGVVVQWVESEAFRAGTRQRLAEAVAGIEPDAVLAHSLGSLVAYDTFTHPQTASAAKGKVFVSFGSQIANPWVAGHFAAGRIRPLEHAAHWFHLFNRHDELFTAPIRIVADNFEQVDTPFDLPGALEHSHEAYLGHRETLARVWSYLAASRVAPGLTRRPARARAIRLPQPTRKALIVGINEYEDWVGPLEGCVNDAYLVSSALQDTGFEAADIRLLLDRRATADALRERLDWLLHDLRAGDVRVFYFSGHGARMPTYAIDEQIDHVDEALVTVDFDWSPEHALVDNEFYQLYSQLPYDVQLLALFDCCHSGGMTRAGARARGISPPADIRHRGQRWNGRRWLERRLQPAPQARTGQAFGDTFERLNPPLASRRHRSPLQSTSFRLGQAMALRLLGKTQYDQVREEQDHHGPYLPLIAYACNEDELAYEETWGTTVHGAFTYFLAQTLRERRNRAEGTTFEDLIRSVGRRIAALHLPQHPQLIGPTGKRSAPVPLYKKGPD
jgi:hypothetical protein